MADATMPINLSVEDIAAIQSALIELAYEYPSTHVRRTYLLHLKHVIQAEQLLRIGEGWGFTPPPDQDEQERRIREGWGYAPPPDTPAQPE